MDRAIEEIKESKYDIKEYPVTEGSGATAVECIPISKVGKEERLNVTALDDLNVCPLLYVPC
jgi:hypothetical protein